MTAKRTALRHDANTRQPRARMSFAAAYPMPDEHPVINMDFIAIKKAPKVETSYHVCHAKQQ